MDNKKIYRPTTGEWVQVSEILDRGSPITFKAGHQFKCLGVSIFNDDRNREWVVTDIDGNVHYVRVRPYRPQEGQKVRVTWVSGHDPTPRVKVGDEVVASSAVSTIIQGEACILLEVGGDIGTYCRVEPVEPVEPKGEGRFWFGERVRGERVFVEGLVEWGYFIRLLTEEECQRVISKRVRTGRKVAVVSGQPPKRSDGDGSGNYFYADTLERVDKEMEMDKEMKQMDVEKEVEQERAAYRARTPEGEVVEGYLVGREGETALLSWHPQPGWGSRRVAADSLVRLDLSTLKTEYSSMARLIGKRVSTLKVEAFEFSHHGSAHMSTPHGTYRGPSVVSEEGYHFHPLTVQPAPTRLPKGTKIVGASGTTYLAHEDVVMEENGGYRGLFKTSNREPAERIISFKSIANWFDILGGVVGMPEIPEFEANQAWKSKLDQNLIGEGGTVSCLCCHGPMVPRSDGSQLCSASCVDRMRIQAGKKAELERSNRLTRYNKDAEEVYAKHRAQEGGSRFADWRKTQTGMAVGLMNEHEQKAERPERPHPWDSADAPYELYVS